MRVMSEYDYEQKKKPTEKEVVFEKSLKSYDVQDSLSSFLWLQLGFLIKGASFFSMLT